MATYTELNTIYEAGTLIARITAAVAIQAEAVRNEAGATTNHTNRMIWAKQAFSDPRAMANRMMWAILAQNAAVTKANIETATDAAILTAVAAAVDVFATGS